MRPRVQKRNLLNRTSRKKRANQRWRRVAQIELTARNIAACFSKSRRGKRSLMVVQRRAVRISVVKGKRE